MSHDTTSHRHVGQISPNKNMSSRCTTAAFTLSAGPDGLRCLVPTRPRELSLLCSSCSSARTFALGLPSAKPSRACPCPRLVVILSPSGPPTGDFHPISSCPCRAYTRRCTGPTTAGFARFRGPVISSVGRLKGSSSANLESASEVPRRSWPRCFVAGRTSCPGRTQGRDKWIRPPSSTSSVSGAIFPRRVHCRVPAERSRRGSESRLPFCRRENQSFPSTQLPRCRARPARVRMASLDGETKGTRSGVASTDINSQKSTAAPPVSGSAWQRCAVGKGCVAAQQTVAADAPLNGDVGRPDGATEGRKNETDYRSHV